MDIKKAIEKINSLPHPVNGFKIKNLAMAIEAAKLCGLRNKEYSPILKKLKDVNGRLELVKKYPNNILVFVDYAHTPDALSKALKYFKE